jgi:hypothetical protein
MKTLSASTILLRKALSMSVEEIESTIQVLREVAAHKSSQPSLTTLVPASAAKGRGKGKRKAKAASASNGEASAGTTTATASTTAASNATEPEVDQSTLPPTAEAIYGWTKQGKVRQRRPAKDYVAFGESAPGVAILQPQTAPEPGPDVISIDSSANGADEAQAAATADTPTAPEAVSEADLAAMEERERRTAELFQ